MRPMLVAACAVTLTACSGPAADGDSRPLRDRGYELYTTEVPEAGFVLAFGIFDHEVISYACGADTARLAHSRWFCGRDDSGPMPGTLRIFRDDWVVDASLDGGGVLSGTLRQEGGEPIPFEAFRESSRSRSDLYVGGSIGPCATGVIVLDRGENSVPSVFGTYCEDGLFGQVTPVSPADWGADRLRVLASTPDGERMRAVDRIRFGDPLEDPGP